MSVDPRFKEVGSFDADAPLDRQLTQLEEHAADAFARVAEQALPRLTPTMRQTKAYTAKLDELVPVGGNAVPVTLPTATSANAGRFVAVEIDGGSASVRSVGCEVQGAQVDELASDGLYLYGSDGVGWWRAPVSAGATSTGAFVTEAQLDASVAEIRHVAEDIRVLLMTLVKLELGDEPDNGVEALLG